MNRTGRIYKGILFVTLLGFAIITGCATTQPNPALNHARSAYARAKSTPGIMEHARVPMHEANNALEKAEKAEDYDDATRLAHLAEKQVEYAVAVAEQKMADEKVEALNLKKQEIVLETRQREIEKAKKEAEAKGREIEVARQQVEEARQQAIQMKSEAEKARKEAEAKAIEADLAHEKAEKLEKEISELKALKTERGLVLTLGDVLFASGKADLMPGANRTIDKLSAFLHENPNRNIVIEGHTDDVGKDDYNLALSQRRADAVSSSLISRGISRDRITTKGYGESYPMADNSTATGRQQNRRVEIIILDEGVSGTSAVRP